MKLSCPRESAFRFPAARLISQAQVLFFFSFRFYLYVRHMYMVLWLCEARMWVNMGMCVHMHVEARCRHWLSSLIAPHFIFQDKFFEPEAQVWLAGCQAPGICLPQPHLRAGLRDGTAPGFPWGVGISSRGVRLPKQALSYPSRPPKPGFLWSWRMCFLPSFPLLLDYTCHHLLPVLRRSRHSRCFLGPHPLSL